MTDDPAGVVEESNEIGWAAFLTVLDVGTVHRVGLPHLVGILLGESQPVLAVDLGVGLEHLVLVDEPAEGIGRHPIAPEDALFQARPVEMCLGRMLAAKHRKHLLDGLEDGLRRDLAGAALVRARLGCHGGDAAALVAIQPGRDRAPGELMGIAVLILEGHLADAPDAVADGTALSKLDRAQHAHLQVRRGILHEVSILCR